MPSASVDYTPKSFPNQAANENLTSTGAVAVSFGFNAAMVKIQNAGGGDAWLKFNTTDPAQASTGGFKLSTGDTPLDLRNLGVGIAGFVAFATSTGVVLRFGAWG